MLHCTRPLPVLALAAAAVAQVGWVQCNPATRPPARGYHSIAYDAVRGVTVLFGGRNGAGPLGDTWEWNGANWTQKFTSVSPPARFGHAFAADISRARIVVFGGTNSIVSGGERNDTWEFDGNNWTQLQPANQPSPRQGARMEYDAARGRIVLFGGFANPNFSLILFSDTWEWNGVVWVPQSPTTSPIMRYGHGMTYDFARARIVLFGGTAFGAGMGDTWTWDGSNWSPVFPCCPTPTQGLGLAYDSGRDLVVRFGGAFTGSETWLFDDLAWRSDPRTVVPTPRSWCSLAHDLSRGRTVLFGGRNDNNGSYFDDTWEYDPGVIARWTRSGSGCAGTSGVPTLRPVGASLPIVGTTFQLELLGIPTTAAAISFGFSNTQWNGNTLPFDLGALGMTGCTLHSSPDFVFFAPVVAGRATLAWSLPNDPGLIGTRFFDQGFALDPAANPLGAIVSNAGAGIVGPF